MSIDKDLEVVELHQEGIKDREIESIRARVPKGLGEPFCGCGNEVPDARRKLGFSNCIECAQADYEKSKLYGRKS